MHFTSVQYKNDTLIANNMHFHMGREMFQPFGAKQSSHLDRSFKGTPKNQENQIWKHSVQGPRI